MTDPVISVVIPHLNQPDHLRSCLRSLTQQTFDMSRVEVIVVDNGSQRSPADVCSAHHHARLVQELTAGPGPARNRGVTLSNGAILAFIDADCIADPNWLTAIGRALAPASGTRVVGGDVRIARSNPQRATMIEAYESIYAYRQEEYIKRHRYSGTGNLAMRREVYDAVGPFCGIDRAEDRDWGQRATTMGFTVQYVPDMIVYHPARQSFAELCTKWDRHISHTFAEDARGPIGRLRWLGRTVAVAGSPLFEARRILTSPRVTTRHERWSAAVVLIRIRIYRARRMLFALFGNRRARSSDNWNRA